MVELLSDVESTQQVTLILDLSSATNSVQACRLVDAFLLEQADRLNKSLININVGELLLTRGVVSKLKQQINQTGAMIGVVFAILPQTQQAALSEGLYVKEEQGKNHSIRLIQHSLLSTQLPQKKVSLPMSGENDLVQKSAQSHPAEEPGQPAQGKNNASTPSFLGGRSKLDLTVQKQILEMAQQQTEDASRTTPKIQTLQTEEGQSIIIEDSDFETLYLRQNLRSGQTISFNGNIIIVGDAHAGSEILAGGDIVIWGELRGIAHAGAKGNMNAQIRAMRIEALQLRIAEFIARRPDKVYYHKERQDTQVTPELAKVTEGEIRIFRNQ
jgi:septum site-determining protein MinC